MQEAIEFLETFFKKPFDPEGDWLSWVLFLGFVMIVCLGWSRVLSKIPTTE